MIYIVGIAHNFQRDRADVIPELSEKQECFRKFVSDAIRDHGITCVVEEIDQDDTRTKAKSIAQTVAECSAPAVRYVICEPTIEERRALGLVTGRALIDSASEQLRGQSSNTYHQEIILRYFPVREAFWLRRISEVQPNSILLICGADHVRTFGCRLMVEGIEWRVISFNWVDDDDRN